MSRSAAPWAICVDWVGYEPVRITISSPLDGRFPPTPWIAVLRSQACVVGLEQLLVLSPIGLAYRIIASAGDGTASTPRAAAIPASLRIPSPFLGTSPGPAII